LKTLELFEYTLDIVNEKLYQRALWLSYFTVGYNIIEAIVSIVTGVFAGSIALIGFGLDSFMESLSAIVMIWRFRKHGKVSKEEEQRIEVKAIKLVAYTFFILAPYVLYVSLDKLLSRDIPEPSLVGIIIAATSMIVMPLLFYLKYRTGKAMGSRSLIADSKETLACFFLSFALLVGLSLNYAFGFWQADPIVGIIIALFLVREGYEVFMEAKEEAEEQAK